jgi:AcrR family transcriptional regulator
MTICRGRPREFDIGEVLDKAVAVFSERGYHGSSIGDLTDAMGLTAGSVYKAFKDKRGIFLAALERYKDQRDALLREAIARAVNGRGAVREALGFYAEASQGALGRRGCLVIGGAAEMATFDDDVAQWIAAALWRNETVLSSLISQGQADGSISPEIDAALTARTLLCVCQGMRLAGKTGRSREDMVAVVDVAMKLLA